MSSGQFTDCVTDLSCDDSTSASLSVSSISEIKLVQFLNVSISIIIVEERRYPPGMTMPSDFRKLRKDSGRGLMIRALGDRR